MKIDAEWRERESRLQFDEPQSEHSEQECISTGSVERRRKEFDCTCGKSSMDEMQQNVKIMQDALGGCEDSEDAVEKLDEIETYYTVFALEDMPNLQRQDPKLAGIITCLSTGDLPVSDKSARQIVMIADQFTVEDDILWYFYSPKSRHKKRKLIPIKQLCIP